MCFNPNVPQENTDLDAGEVRGNFNALKVFAGFPWCLRDP